MKKRRFKAILLLSLLLCHLLSCSAHPPTARAVLGAMCRSESALPAGEIYVRLAPQDGEAYLSDEMLSVIFGNGSLPPEAELIADAALYLSYTRHCEMAALLCKSTDGTDAIATMCLRRLDSLKSYWIGEESAENSMDFDQARVTVCGRWVIMTLCSDPEAALRAARRTL